MIQLHTTPPPRQPRFQVADTFVPFPGILRGNFPVGGFIPAFARCCFCIAANLLVFTSPTVFPLLPCSIPNLPRKPPRNLSLHFLLRQAYTVKHIRKCQTLLPNALYARRIEDREPAHADAEEHQQKQHRRLVRNYAKAFEHRPPPPLVRHFPASRNPAVEPRPTQSRPASTRCVEPVTDGQLSDAR